MVRTAASAARASGGKSAKAVSKSSQAGTFKASSSNSDRNSVGGNAVCPRETPVWQKPITNFLNKFDKTSETSSSSNSKKIDNELLTASDASDIGNIEKNKNETPSLLDTESAKTHSTSSIDSETNQKVKNTEIDEFGKDKHSHINESFGEASSMDSHKANTFNGSTGIEDKENKIGNENTINNDASKRKKTGNEGEEAAKRRKIDYSKLEDIENYANLSV